MKPKAPQKCCKKCGCELTSDNKSGLCQMHKRKRADDLKKIGGALLGLVGTAFLLIPKFDPRKK